MKHNTKITLILMLMFIATQIIGIFVVHVYTNGLLLPYGMEPPQEMNNDFSIVSILISFIIAITIFLLLIKFKAETFIRIWFFIVTILAISLALNAFIFKFNYICAQIAAVLIAIPLAYIKIFRRNLLVHNITELLIYPGIAAVFVPILNIFGIIILLFIISLYDIWAVWHTAFMQKMAKYQINNLRFFTGFFIPYIGKKDKEKIQFIKDKYKNKSKEQLENQLKKSKIKVNLAILGGGDIIFPIITAGIFYKTYFSLLSAFVIAIFAAISLLILFILARKGKFYPAMPFLTIGLYLAIIFNWLFIV